MKGRAPGLFTLLGAENPHMLSTKLVQLIENNWEEIANRLIAEVKKHPDLRTLASRPDLELREWCQDILQNLGPLLSAKKDEEMQKRFEVLGKVRFEENVPLHEAILRFQLFKDKIFGFIHEQGFPMSAMQLYAEEELEHRIGRFFDACVYHMVRGYEYALRVQGRLATA